MKLFHLLFILPLLSVANSDLNIHDDWIPIRSEVMSIECFSPKDEIQIINSSKQYNQLRWDNQWPARECDSYIAPEIDFSKWTLIHVTAHLGGSTPKTALRVMKNEESGKVKVIFTATQTNNERNLQVAKKWYIIEKCESENISIEVIVN